MAAVNVTIIGTITTPSSDAEGGGAKIQQCTIQGMAALSDFHPEHPIVIPPDKPPGMPPGDYHPEHPIYWPPGTQPHPEHPIVIPKPPDPFPQPPPGGEGKPPPPGGGWGYHPDYGWGYFPGSSTGVPGPK